MEFFFCWRIRYQTAMSLDEYRPTDAVTRHSPFVTDLAAESRDPQFLVHLSENERVELQKAFDRAIQKAGEAGVSRESIQSFHRTLMASV